MNLFHRRSHEEDHDPEAQAEASLDDTAYDAQADLALPTESPRRHIEVGAPFAGMVDAPAEDAGYDLERDIAD
jgi:hypothetical protein